jgi:hypothetical protein
LSILSSAYSRIPIEASIAGFFGPIVERVYHSGAELKYPDNPDAIAIASHRARDYSDPRGTKPPCHRIADNFLLPH